MASGCAIEFEVGTLFSAIIEAQLSGGVEIGKAHV